MNNDNFLHILENVNTVRDLLSMCAVNKTMFEYCEDNKRGLWKNLMNNMDFKRDYFAKFNYFLKHSDYPSIFKLLNIYAIQNENQIDFLENLKEFLKMNKTIDDKSKININVYFKLLFYPPEFYKLRLEDVQYFDNDEKGLVVDYFVKNPDMEILAGFIYKAFTDHLDYPNGYKYIKELYKYLPEQVAEFTTDTIYDIIYSEINGNPFKYTPDTIEFQDIFGDIYEDIKNFYDSFNLEKYRQKKQIEFQKLIDSN
jgi:hypothetical protein